VNRRDFLKTSLAGAGVAAGVVAGSAAADAKPATEAKAVLKLSSQENVTVHALCKITDRKLA